MRTPFQILNPVISKIAINMVYLFQFGRRADKCRRDQSGYVESFPGISSEVHLEIPSRSDRIRFEDSDNISAPEACDPSVIADDVKLFVSWDCFPNFSFDNWLRHFRPFCSRLIVKACVAATTATRADLTSGLAGVNP